MFSNLIQYIYIWISVGKYLIWCNLAFSIIIVLVTFVGDNIKTVKTPPFPDSVTEGDIRWEKGTFQSS
jgi:hypothetical protein